MKIVHCFRMIVMTKWKGYIVISLTVVCKMYPVMFDFKSKYIQPATDYKQEAQGALSHSPEKPV